MKMLALLFALVLGVIGLIFLSREMGRQAGREAGKEAAKQFQQALYGTPEQQAKSRKVREAENLALERQLAELENEEKNLKKSAPTGVTSGVK
ncbi:MAG: hypothetical protein ABIT37_03855 [Luteolibacter sp.]